MSRARAIVVTGCTRGLGRALCGFFRDEGHTVIGCARNAERVTEMARAFGPPHDIAPVDVADDAAVGAWARRVLALRGPPDLQVNNAAVIAPLAPLWEVPADAFSRVIDVNVKGVASAIRHFAPAMAAAGRGVIANISSGWGRSTSPEVAAYCAAKWAVEGLTQALAQELPRGLAAVAVNPGIIDTDMLRACWGDEAGRYPRPEAWVLRAGPFLLSLGARHNGQALSVPGIPLD